MVGRPRSSASSQGGGKGSPLFDVALMESLNAATSSFSDSLRGIVFDGFAPETSVVATFARMSVPVTSLAAARSRHRPAT